MIIYVTPGIREERIPEPSSGLTALMLYKEQAEALIVSCERGLKEWRGRLASYEMAGMPARSINTAKTMIFQREMDLANAIAERDMWARRVLEQYEQERRRYDHPVYQRRASEELCT